MAPSTGRRQRQTREETRRLIMDAAYGLFEEKGYRLATMRELAARAGVGLGTIFQHFPDKAALLSAAFAEDIGAVAAGALRSLPEKDIRAQLLHIAETMYAFYASRPRLSRELVLHVFQTEGEEAGRLRTQAETFIGAVAALFEAAKGRGEIRPGVDSRTAALAAWSYYLTCLIEGLWRPEPDPASQLELLSQILDQHLAGIGAG